MYEAKIGIIEDNKEDYDVAKSVLQREGHAVVRRAKNDDEARQLLEDIALDPGMIDVLLVDGNLKRGEDTGRSAKEVLDRASDLGLNTFLIFHSMAHPSQYGIESGFDDAVIKGRMHYFSSLRSAVEDL